MNTIARAYLTESAQQTTSIALPHNGQKHKDTKSPHIGRGNSGINGQHPHITQRSYVFCWGTHQPSRYRTQQCIEVNAANFSGYIINFWKCKLLARGKKHVRPLINIKTIPSSQIIHYLAQITELAPVGEIQSGSNH
ncbi:hypothetical protein, unlikely [Trypanosoma brucei gambiense DAL972]|uniref:Uncharacterized protein n=1 Tax=Trypanosoma brucei gambiense (strain MHOM/CI/86/DAL972) TaxID=679716 RepID=C9ZTD3_TRYB9|nr:hypothetical protein, unlikely [Trypanosoma brucei gambiense DAL972]CBH12668.1 hypothetical protein, unlikely [Trypanosoma brucei gambiense DAL972]|eukprot:XP_011774948.1 hypothetical protein, unlikely [Trypanosoma brucei gambiense DAL972]